MLPDRVLGGPLVPPRPVPKARGAAPRNAFMEALKDKDLLADAKTRHLDIQPISGEEVQSLVAKVYAMPAAIVAKAKEALIYKDQ